MTASETVKGDNYWLGRNYTAATRLNLQHFMWKDAQGFMLHPEIQAHLQKENEARQAGDKQPLEIADLASGTGIWIFDLMNSQESKGLDVQYHGFDISARQFPHSAWVPKNVTFLTSNLFNEPPKELQGKFDVLHIRLILTLVRDNDAKALSQLIQNLKLLLRPGGYLQWDELDHFNHHTVLTPSPEIQASKMYAATQKTKEFINSRWVANLAQILKDEGFEATAQSAHVPRNELSKAWTCLDMCVMDELSHYGMGRDANEEATSLMQLLPEALEEADNLGAIIRLSPTVTIARKPL